MSATLVNVRSKKVPTLYEADERKYVGPHTWQVQGWARLIRRLMHQRAYARWVRQACSSVDVSGLDYLTELRGPCLFIANHQSHLDTLLVKTSLPARFRDRLYFGAAQDRWFVKGKKKLTLKPWYQSLVLGNFPILRGGGAKALSYAHRLLGRGEHVFLFPEGTRATSGALGEFRHGAALLALEHDVTVVPIYLSGLQAIRPKGSRETTRGAAGVEFLKPIRFSRGSDVEAATRLLHQRLSAVHQKHANEVLSEAA